MIATQYIDRPNYTSIGGGADQKGFYFTDRAFYYHPSINDADQFDIVFPEYIFSLEENKWIFNKSSQRILGIKDLETAKRRLEDVLIGAIYYVMQDVAPNTIYKYKQS